MPLRDRARGKILGASCYDSLERAAPQCGWAPITSPSGAFSLPHQPDARRAPLSLFRHDLGVPLCAIGGITLENAPAVIAAGASLLAVITDVFDEHRRPCCSIPQALLMKRSKDLFERAQRAHPGGVNSPVRAFQAVGGTPRYSSSAPPAPIYGMPTASATSTTSARGDRCSPATGIRRSWRRCRKRPRALSFGAPTEAEIELAELLCRQIASLELVRLVSSGTEATMTALRLARGFHRRSLIVKFEGCYHGHADALLVKAGSGALTFGNPSSAGVPAQVAAQTVVLDYNDVAGQEPLCRKRQGNRGGDRRAGRRQHEPGASRARVPRGTARSVPQHGAVLIFDEVMTGFRVAPRRCAAAWHPPDLTTLGKVIGGGLPLTR